MLEKREIAVLEKIWIWISLQKIPPPPPKKKKIKKKSSAAAFMEKKEERKKGGGVKGRGKEGERVNMGESIRTFSMNFSLPPTSPHEEPAG